MQGGRVSVRPTGTAIEGGWGEDAGLLPPVDRDSVGHGYTASDSY